MMLPAAQQTCEILRRDEGVFGGNLLSDGTDKFSLDEIFGGWSHPVSIFDK